MLKQSEHDAWWAALESDLRENCGATLMTVRGPSNQVTSFKLRCHKCDATWTFPIGKGGVIPHNARVCPNGCNAGIAGD